MYSGIKTYEDQDKKESSIHDNIVFTRIRNNSEDNKSSKESSMESSKSNNSSLNELKDEKEIYKNKNIFEEKKEMGNKPPMIFKISTEEIYEKAKKEKLNQEEETDTTSKDSFNENASNEADPFNKDILYEKPVFDIPVDLIKMEFMQIIHVK